MKKRVFAAALLLTAVILMLTLSGCTENDALSVDQYKHAEQGTILLDYFERVVGTPEEQGYHELVFYAYSDTQALLEEYTDGGLESESVTAYLVPLEAVQKGYDAVRESGMDRWQERDDLVGICGRSVVCKFPDGKGGLIRVSSDAMPEDGESAFNAVYSAIAPTPTKHTSNDNHVQEVLPL